ncbi:MAG: hypothetical protein AAF962_15250 [Actinomycetota bacterium]
MTPALSPRILRGRRSPATLLGRNAELLSLDVFGLALQPTFLDDGDRHDLVASIVAKRFPAMASEYRPLREQAERKARAAAAIRDIGEAPLAVISDHLHELLLDAVEPDDASAIARLSIDTEIELGRMLGRPNPDALELHRQARERGIATAMVADTPLPRDLVDRIVRACGYLPDHVLVSSNEGRRKGGGLFQRLVAKTGVTAGAVVHFGPDQELDVEVPRRLGIAGYLAPAPGDSAPQVVLGLGAPGGLDSLALTLANRHLTRTASRAERGFDVGYYAAGPLLVGFAAWLGSEIDRLEPDRVLLCGRIGPLVDRTLDILRPDLPVEGRHVLTPTPDGRCPVDRLAGQEPLREAERVLVGGLGLFDEPHRYAQKILNADGAGPEVRGAYVGLPNAPDASAAVWAFDDADDCEVRSAAYRRPEVLEALLRLLPPSPQDLEPGLRPFHTEAAHLAAGAEMFAEDIEPWLQLDHDGFSAVMIEPALRVIVDPTATEARVLAPYPIRGESGEQPAHRLAVLPPRTLAARRPGMIDAAAGDAAWAEGYQALAGERPHLLPGRGRRRSAPVGRQRPGGGSAA